jgi:hypothetical protein
MAVDDHGLEAIRKAAEEVTPGDKSDYKIKTDQVSKDYNAVEALSQSISTTAALIELPDSANEIEIRHDSDSTLWIGGDDSVAANSGWPLYRRETLCFNLKEGNNNDVWAISSSGSITTFVIGVFKQ